MKKNYALKLSSTIFCFLLSTIFLHNIVFSQTDGELDLSFNPGAGANNIIYALALQPDGKILIGGDFTTYNNETRNRIARLNSDGTIDSSFDPHLGADAMIEKIVLQADGKILICGYFNTFNNYTAKRFARLNSDGSFDATFNQGTGINGEISPRVKAITVLSDGKILIGGRFSSYNNQNCQSVARLNSNGTYDNTFNQTNPVSGWINSITQKPNGQLIIAGDFAISVGVNYYSYINGIACLNANGTVNLQYGSEYGPGGGINTISYRKVVPGWVDAIWIAGNFNGFISSQRNYIDLITLNLNGYDDSAAIGTGANDEVTSLIVQPDDQVLISGRFTSYNGTPCNRITRLNGFDFAGSIDTDFQPGSAANNYINSMALQPDGKILIAGAFTSFDGTNRNRIARLHGSSSSLSISPQYKKDITIYPNPVNSHVNIMSDIPIEVMRIISLNGQELIKSSSNNIDVSNISPGFYYVEINGSYVQSFVKK